MPSVQISFSLELYSTWASMSSRHLYRPLLQIYTWLLHLIIQQRTPDSFHTNLLDQELVWWAVGTVMARSLRCSHSLRKAPQRSDCCFFVKMRHAGTAQMCKTDFEFLLDNAQDHTVYLSLLSQSQAIQDRSVYGIAISISSAAKARACSITSISLSACYQSILYKRLAT